MLITYVSFIYNLLLLKAISLAFAFCTFNKASLTNIFSVNKNENCIYGVLWYS